MFVQLARVDTNILLPLTNPRFFFCLLFMPPWRKGRAASAIDVHPPAHGSIGKSQPLSHRNGLKKMARQGETMTAKAIFLQPSVFHSIGRQRSKGRYAIISTCQSSRMVIQPSSGPFFHYTIFSLFMILSLARTHRRSFFCLPHSQFHTVLRREYTFPPIDPVPFVRSLRKIDI